MCKGVVTVPPSPLFLVVQEGGTSSELYASTYDTRGEAEAAIRSHDEATYNAYGPFEFPAGLTPEQEADVLELIQDVGGCVARRDYQDPDDLAEPTTTPAAVNGEPEEGAADFDEGFGRSADVLRLI